MRCFSFFATLYYYIIIIIIWCASLSNLLRIYICYMHVSSKLYERDL